MPKNPFEILKFRSSMINLIASQSKKTLSDFFVDSKLLIIIYLLHPIRNNHEILSCSIREKSLQARNINSQYTIIYIHIQDISINTN